MSTGQYDVIVATNGHTLARGTLVILKGKQLQGCLRAEYRCGPDGMVTVLQEIVPHIFALVDVDPGKLESLERDYDFVLYSRGPETMVKWKGNALGMIHSLTLTADARTNEVKLHLHALSKEFLRACGMAEGPWIEVTEKEPAHATE